MLELCTVFCVQKSYIYTPTGDRIGHARVVAKSRRTMKMLIYAQRPITESSTCTLCSVIPGNHFKVFTGVK